LHEDHDTEIHARNARYGLILFSVYLLLYAGFVGLSAFSRRPKSLRKKFEIVTR